MTAITTLVGLVPIVYQKPALAGIYYYSMALVIMGGLVVSTFLTSVLLPTTASLAEDGFALVGRGIARSWRVVTLRGRKTRRAGGGGVFPRFPIRQPRFASAPAKPC